MHDLTAIQRTTNSNSYFKAFQYLESKAQEIGLFNIKLIEQPASRYEWEVRKAELWILSPITRKLANFHAINTSLAVFSRTSHAMAELVDVGSGESDTDYANRDIANKIVLANGALVLVMRKAVWEYGALGVIWYSEHKTGDQSENIASRWHSIPISDGNGKTGTFAFVISTETANELKQIIRSRSDRATLGREKSENKATSILLRVDIEGNVRNAGKKWQLMADIPGEEILSEDIVLTAILPDNALPPFGDCSGVAGLLEIARTLTRLINDGLLPVPRRSIRFWWTSNSQDISQFFINRPEAKDSVLANIHLGEIGSANRFSDGMALALSPSSNTSYWNNIVASTAYYLRDINNMSRSATYRPRHFLRPVLSQLGSKDSYHFEIPAYFVHPIQQIFTQSAIGIPSLVITSQRSANIAAQNQIFGQLDPTQLKRNAFLATAASWYLARFRDNMISELVSVVYSQGKQNVARALEIAFRLVGKDQVRGYALAEFVIEETIAREEEALRSISILATGSQALEVIDDFSDNFRDDLKTAKNRLKLFYTRHYERRPPKTGRLNKAEKRALRTIPRNNPVLADYLSRKHRTGDELQTAFANNILDFVNGRRSVYEIYRAVIAKAILTGFLPYESLSLTKVRAVIDEGVKSG
ncbi:MAG: hypothetical protein ACE5I1_05055, partial [bacterium]